MRHIAGCDQLAPAPSSCWSATAACTAPRQSELPSSILGVVHREQSGLNHHLQPARPDPSDRWPKAAVNAAHSSVMNLSEDDGHAAGVVGRGAGRDRPVPDHLVGCRPSTPMIPIQSGGEGSHLSSSPSNDEPPRIDPWAVSITDVLDSDAAEQQPE